MLRRLLCPFIITAALAPLDVASAQEVTWQEVAQSMFIIAGTPVPYESELLSDYDLQNRRAVQVVNPTYLKGGASDVPVLLLMLPYDLVLWNQPTVFFVREFSTKEGVDGREIYGWTSWYDHEGMFSLNFGPRPRLYTDELAARIKILVAQNERYREIGAAYRPDPDDPLLAEVQNDLHEIANAVKLQGVTEPDEIEPHSLAIRRLYLRGEAIVPRLVSLLDSDESFPAGYIIEDPTHFHWTDVGPPPSADTMAEAIDILLSHRTGFFPWSGPSMPVEEATVEAWHTYLGYQLSGIDPADRYGIDWKLIARSQYIIEGTLSLPEKLTEPDIHDRTSSAWATLSDVKFLKGEDQGAPYRISVDMERAKDIEGKVVVFSDEVSFNGDDHKPFYSLTYLAGQSAIRPSGSLEFTQRDTLIAIDQTFGDFSKSFAIDPNDPYWGRLRSSLEKVTEAPGEDEMNAAVQRVVEYGEPAVPYLISLLTDQKPWPYGKIFSFLKEPWRGGRPTLYAENWAHLSALLLLRIAEEPLSEHPFSGSFSEPGLSAYWNTYLGQRLSTPEGRLALSHDPAVSKAEASRRTIAAELPVGSSRDNIEGFFAGQDIDPVYDEISYYGKITPRYQVVVPDAAPDDDLDEIVVVHLFLDETRRLVASDVRYLFDLYR